VRAGDFCGRDAWRTIPLTVFRLTKRFSRDCDKRRCGRCKPAPRFFLWRQKLDGDERMCCCEDSVAVVLAARSAMMKFVWLCCLGWPRRCGSRARRRYFGFPEFTYVFKASCQHQWIAAIARQLGSPPRVVHDGLDQFIAIAALGVAVSSSFVHPSFLILSLSWRSKFHRESADNGVFARKTMSCRGVSS